MGLIKRFDAVLADVAVLPDVTRIEHPHNRLAFDEHPSIGKLPVSLFFRPAEPSSQPIAAALAWIAGSVGRQSESSSGGVGWRCRGDMTDVGASARVLDVITNDGYGPPLIRSLDVKSRGGIQ